MVNYQIWTHIFFKKMHRILSIQWFPAYFTILCWLLISVTIRKTLTKNSKDNQFAIHKSLNEILIVDNTLQIRSECWKNPWLLYAIKSRIGNGDYVKEITTQPNSRYACKFPLLQVRAALDRNRPVQIFMNQIFINF